ncbi:PilN domain-containing protein [Aliidiomarina sp. Khilg15.8]
MKYHINLYTDALKPKRDWLTLKTLLFAMLALVVVILLLRLVSAWQSYQLDNDLEQVNQRMSAMQQSVTSLTQRARAQRPQPDLEQRIARLEDDVVLMQALARELENRGGFSEQNYARILRDLSAIHQQGLWLTHIENDKGELVLTGKTVNSAYLPRWMSRFEQVESLRGRQFAVVALERDERSLLNFELRSQRRTQSQEGERR